MNEDTKEQKQKSQPIIIDSIDYFDNPIQEVISPTPLETKIIRNTRGRYNRRQNTVAFRLSRNDGKDIATLRRFYRTTSSSHAIRLAIQDRAIEIKRIRKDMIPAHESTNIETTTL